MLRNLSCAAIHIALSCFAFICVRILVESFLICSHYSARRFQISAVETSIINRLLTPTQASLAKSKSAAVLSAAGKDPSGNRHLE